MNSPIALSRWSRHFNRVYSLLAVYGVAGPDQPPVAPAIRATPVISPSAPEPESPIVPAPTASTATPQDAATLQKVEALQKLLIHYLGPAANWVFSDVQAIWQQRHGATLTNLPQLVELLLPEFDMETDRIGFQQQAKHIINP